MKKLIAILMLLATSAQAQLGPSEEMTVRLIIAARSIAEVGMGVTFPSESIEVAEWRLPDHSSEVVGFVVQHQFVILCEDLPEVYFVARCLFVEDSGEHVFRVRSITAGGDTSLFSGWSPVWADTMEVGNADED